MTDAAKVSAYMEVLEHPLKAEIEAIRKIISGASGKIAERIKWNAPSYYYRHDLVTFHPRSVKRVHLVFHDIAITGIASDLLEGDYKDRRMMYFNDMKAVRSGRKELERIIKELVLAMDQLPG